MKTKWVIAVVIVIAIAVGWFYFSGGFTFEEKISPGDFSGDSGSETEIPTEDFSGDSGSEAEIPQENYNINIENFAFSSQELRIKVGETVIWTNLDSAKHTVTSDSGSEMDSALLRKGDSYTHVFNEAGIFYYHCAPHPYMTGRIIVE